jgi:hypothetical protein
LSQANDRAAPMECLFRSISSLTLAALSSPCRSVAARERAYAISRHRRISMQDGCQAAFTQSVG